jgi:hypothetical protein
LSSIVCCGHIERIGERILAKEIYEEQNKNTLTPEIDCDQMAMGFPPATSAVFLIAT